MAILPIFKYPDPVLRKQTETGEKFDDELKSLVSNMAETGFDLEVLSQEFLDGLRLGG